MPPLGLIDPSLNGSTPAFWQRPAQSTQAASHRAWQAGDGRTPAAARRQRGWAACGCRSEHHCLPARARWWQTGPAAGGGMVLAELGGAIKGALSKLNNATVIDEEGACVCRRKACRAAVL